MPEEREQNQPTTELSQQQTSTLIRESIEEVATIIPPKQYQIPEEFDTSQANDPEALEMFLQNAVRFLQLPIIKDEFLTHTARREWRKQKAKEIKEKYGHETARKFENTLGRNKMKIVKLDPIYQLITTYLQQDISAEHQEKISKLMKGDIIDTSQDQSKKSPWDGPTTPKKIEKVEKLSDLVAEILKSFEKS